MDTYGLILLILQGGLLGVMGQGLRIIVGLKKMDDRAADEHKTFGEAFDGSALLASIVIAFAVGALVVILLENEVATAMAAAGDADAPDHVAESVRRYLFGILAAGYAGTDFIEGVFKKFLPGRAARSRGGPRTVT